MNPALNARGQHEMHPDAETLSAFAELALSATGRDEVLAHLAVCGRCRQVVALAREAAGAEVAEARHQAARPRAWWRSWGLALVPAAALAATAVITFEIHERAVERTAEVAKLEQQQANEKAAMPPQALPEPRTDAVQPTPATPVDAPARPGETERPGEARRKHVAEPDETAGAAPPEEANRPASEREEYKESPSTEIPGAMAYAHAPTHASADDRTPSEAAIYDEERKKHAEAAEEERHQYAAKATTPSSPNDSQVDKPGIDQTGIDNAGSAPAGNPTPASSEQVEVDAQQLQMEPAPDVNAGELKSLRLSGFSGAHMTRPIRLPNGLPALSIASIDHCMLAIDKKGTLFFSDDSGLTWEKVKRQWTGRAIAVRTKTAEDATPSAATVPRATENATNSLSQSETVFELVNDQSELWLSADGRIWTVK